VHALHLQWVAAAPVDRSQHGRPHAKDADLGLERRRMGGRHLRNRHLALEYAPDGREVDSELAQGLDEAEARERVRAVQPVAPSVRPAGGSTPRSE
jgi:hypothetical protein